MLPEIPTSPFLKEKIYNIPYARHHDPLLIREIKKRLKYNKSTMIDVSDSISLEFEDHGIEH